MEVYKTKDNKVSKYIHDDGSETAIKTVNSCGNIFNKITNKIEPIEVDRNKYTVFISSSVGCPVGCEFCYLSSKDIPYYKLKPNQIIENFKEALEENVKENEDIRKKYIKLSWMGMGDALLLDPYDLREMSEYMISWAVGNKNFAMGIDGVDISTTMPRECNGLPYQLGMLNDYLRNRHRRNPTSLKRSVVRVFYSLHDIENRKKLIPMSSDVQSDLERLFEIKRIYGLNIIIHHLLLKGINDNESYIGKIKDLIKDLELRILRYNKCERSNFEETNKFDELVRLYAENLPKVKYQTSSGSEVKAACGMFLLKKKKNNIHS